MNILPGPSVYANHNDVEYVCYCLVNSYFVNTQTILLSPTRLVANLRKIILDIIINVSYVVSPKQYKLKHFYEKPVI